jgi:uncharacterized protein (DUF885 family)
MPLPSLTDILVHYLLLLRKSFQPFKTVKDYENWLKRIEGFTKWADIVLVTLIREFLIGMVLPKALVLK